MKITKYLEEKENLKHSNKLLKFFVVVIGIAVIINTFIVYTLTKNQKTVIVPPVYSDQYFITGSDASDEYFYSMAKFVSFLMLNYNPGTARTQFNHFLKFCSADSFTKYKDVLYSLADKIETGQVSSSFYPSRVKVNRGEKTIEIEGVLDQYTQGKQFITNESKRYKIKYEIENGFFRVKSFEEVKS